jgi:hypothetical protein
MTVVAGYATLPKQDDATPARMTFTLDVKDEAPFMIWVKYRPGYVKKLDVPVEIDGKNFGTWRLRAPYRLMGRTLVSGRRGALRTYVDKLMPGGKDVFRLTPGRHTITLVLDPALGDGQHSFAEVTATNDHSYRPEGYDPRADFMKRRR